MHAGQAFDLRELQEDVSTCSIFQNAIVELEALQHMPVDELEAHASDVVRCVDAALRRCAAEHAGSGAQTRLPEFLLTVAEVAVSCPALWEALRGQPYSELVLEWLQHVGMWDAHSAASVVHAYGRLVSMRLARKADESLMKVLLAIVLRHVADLHACEVADVVSSVATSYDANHVEVFGTIFRPLQQTVACVAHDMTAQDVSRTVWAFATAREQLGRAEGPVLAQVSTTAASMHAHHVADVLWALCVMKRSLGSTESPMIHAVTNVADSMQAPDVASTLHALSRMKVDLGTAHAPLVKAVERVAGSMSAQDVSNTLRALCTMNADLGVAHEPLVRAVEVVAEHMSARDVQSTLRTFATIRRGWRDHRQAEQCLVQAQTCVPCLWFFHVSNAPQYP